MQDNCLVKLSLMPNSLIILTTLKKIKIHFLFDFIVIIKFILPCDHSETHFPYKTLGMAQVEGTIFIMFIYPVIFQDFVIVLFLLLF